MNSMEWPCDLPRDEEFEELHRWCLDAASSQIAANRCSLSTVYRALSWRHCARGRGKFPPNTPINHYHTYV